MRPIVLAANVTVLSQRQFEVLEAAANGMGVKETMRLLGIGAETVSTHRATLCKRLGAKNITQAVGIACKGGLL